MYQVEIRSLTGQTLATLRLSQAEYSKLVMQVRDGDGLLTIPQGDETLYRLVPARSVGWIDVAETAVAEVEF